MSNYNFGNFNNRNPFYNQRPPSPIDGIKRFFRSKSLLSRLIIINLAVFLLVNLVKLYFYLFQQNFNLTETGGLTVISYWLAVPSNTELLILKPWTVFTYMFLHESFLHLLFNMIMLYAGGVIFDQYLGKKKLLITYLLGGLSGAIFYISAFNFFPVFSEVNAESVAMGASASVLAIIVAIATYMPDYSLRFLFIGQVKFKWVAIAFIILDLLSIQKGNAGGHIAHLGGAFSGFVYILILKKRLIFNQLFNPIRKFFTPKPKIKSTGYKRPVSDDDFNLQRKIHQQKIDAILDKIKKSGYESLSKEEKELLFRESKK